MGILLCLFTGLRIGEICALRWGDLSFPDQTIHVHQTMQRVQDRSDHAKRKTKVVVTTPKSSCSIRTIPVPAPLMEMKKESMQRQFALFAVRKCGQPL